MDDLVSVVVPVFNRESYVRESIDSILAQTYKSVEIIAVNDGSTDDSLSVLEGYRDQFPRQVVVIDQPNAGQVVARNNALAEAKGQYIAFLDSDDAWMPNKLERQIPLFRANVGLVYSAALNVGPDGTELDVDRCDPRVRGDAYLELLQGNRMTGGSVVVTREALDRVGYFDPNLDAAENWDLWIRVSRQFELDFVEAPLVRYRKHPDNMSKDHGRMMNAIEMILEKHCTAGEGDSEKANACRKARAAYAYRQGVHSFSAARYRSARGHFEAALGLQPGYRDARSRLLRTYLGRSGNMILSVAGKVLRRTR